MTEQCSVQTQPNMLYSNKIPPKVAGVLGLLRSYGQGYDAQQNDGLTATLADRRSLAHNKFSVPTIMPTQSNIKLGVPGLPKNQNSLLGASKNPVGAIPRTYNRYPKSISCFLTINSES